MDGDRSPMPYLRSPANEDGGRISPDGRWLAYASDETGENEIYVQSFPEPGCKVRVSLDGGWNPSWAEGGRQLHYTNDVGAFIAVPVKEGEEFQPGAPRKLGDWIPGVTSRDRLGDGSRMLVSVAGRTRPRAIRLILDWTALLAR